MSCIINELEDCAINEMRFKFYEKRGKCTKIVNSG